MVLTQSSTHKVFERRNTKPTGVLHFIYRSKYYFANQANNG